MSHTKLSVETPEVCKVCPVCGAAASLSADECRSCGRRFRTAFIPQSGSTRKPLSAKIIAPQSFPANFSNPPPNFSHPVVLPEHPAPSKPALMPSPGLLVFSSSAEAWYRRCDGRSGLRSLTWIIPVAGFAVWAIAYLLWNMTFLPAPVSLPMHSSAPQAAVTAEASAVSVSSSTLDQDFRTNTFAANTQYKGKMVTIAGLIKDIGTSADGYPYVCFNGQSNTSSVLCVFEPGSEQSVSSLAIGRHAQVIGCCDGNFHGFVTLGRCTLIAQTPDSVLTSGAPASL